MEKDCNSCTEQRIDNAKGSLYPCSEEQGLSSPFEPTRDKKICAKEEKR